MGFHSEHLELIGSIRAVEKECRQPIAIIGDLQGPKFRIGEIGASDISLKVGQIYKLHLGATAGDDQGCQLPHPEIFSAIGVGQKLLVDDGKVIMEALEVGAELITVEVKNDGLLMSRKGVNIPDTDLSISAITDKDKLDLEFALEHDVDWIAMSFVQRPEDILELKSLVKQRAGVIAKIEKPQAYERIDEIVRVSDAIMVARGDLGVEMPAELVPIAQRNIVNSARYGGKPVIVATQMLDSMIERPVPTRAEASDVANAVYEAADAVMLSAETASGKFPIEAVVTMQKIINATESDKYYRSHIQEGLKDMVVNDSDAIAMAACEIARGGNISSITCFSSTGATAIRISRLRPLRPILALTPKEKISRRLSLVWGCYCIRTKDVSDFREMIGKALRIANRESLISHGKKIVVTAGEPFGISGNTNILRLASFDELGLK